MVQTVTLSQLGLDMFDPQAIAHPHQFYQRLRDEAPIIFSEQTQGWVLSRYEDVRHVLRNPDLFSSVRIADGTDGAGIIGRTDVVREQVAPPDALTMLNSDRPDHTRLRKLLSLDFTPNKINRMLPRIEELCSEFLTGAASRESFDVVTELADPLPVTIIAELLGIPSDQGAQFKQWSDAAIAPLAPDVSDAEVAAQNKLIVEFRTYLQEQIAQRHSHPTDDFIGRLVAAQDEESKLSDDEVLAGVNLLLLAGNETTTNLISNAVLALTRFPDRQRELRAHPELITNAVEEFLRYDGSVQFTIRTLTKPAEFYGQELEVGARLVIVLASANRDERIYPNPDQLDFHRPKGKHLGLGDWIHICLGQFLARMETRAALLGVVEEYPFFELAVPEAEILYRPNFNLRGPSYLPIRACAR
ncbi:MAG: cytochrome P450 [Gammaproteobacteria bacterium]|nr:cytochrome P450 [Gammaproteobacteria bacterium]